MGVKRSLYKDTLAGGTLTNVVRNGNGILELARDPHNLLKAVFTTTGSSGDLYGRASFKRVDIGEWADLAVGDVLDFEMWADAEQGDYNGIGIDFFHASAWWNSHIFPNNFKDQNGLHVLKGDVGPYATRQWYRRRVALDVAQWLLPYTTDWFVAVDSDALGTFTVYLRNVHLEAADGTLKHQLFGNEDTLDLTGRAQSYGEGRSTNGRGASLTIIPRWVSSGERIGDTLDISTTGQVVETSIGLEAVTTPPGTSVSYFMRLSLDGGDTWGDWTQIQAGDPIPGVTPGTDLSNARVQTKQVLTLDGDILEHQTPTAGAVAFTIGVLDDSIVQSIEDFEQRRVSYLRDRNTGDFERALAGHILGARGGGGQGRLIVAAEQNIYWPGRLTVSTEQEILADSSQDGINGMQFGVPQAMHVEGKKVGGFIYGVLKYLALKKFTGQAGRLSVDTEQVIVSAVPDVRVRYTARLFDQNGQIVAVLNMTKEPSFKKVAGQANEFRFSLLVTDDKLPLLQLATHAELYRFEQRILAGRIVGRDFSKAPYQFRGLTNELYLADDPLLVTPEDWRKYEGWEAADALRDLIRGFRTFTLSQREDWEHPSGTRYQVDTSTMPGDVILGKQGGTSKYQPSGYVITRAIDLGADCVAFDRLRWAQEVGTATRITVQTSSSSDLVNWSAWTPERESVDPGLGLEIEAPFARYVRLKVNLYTTNTTAKNSAGQEQGFTPILRAVQVVARYPSRLWDAGIPASFGKTLRGLNLSRTSFLEAYQQIASKTGLEWRVTEDFGVIFGSQLGTDLSYQVILSEGENAVIETLQDDDDFANAIQGWGAGEGVDQLRTDWIRDEVSIAQYGYEKRGYYENKDLTVLSDLVAATQAELQRRAYPTPALVVRIAAKNPDWPPFGLGDTIRLVSQKRGLNLTARIVEESRSDGVNGEIIRLGLNARIRNIMEQVADTQRTIAQQQRIQAETTAPGQPFNLSAVGEFQKISLSWTGEADYYIIEHNEGGPGEARTLLESRWPGRTYVHAGLVIGSTHYYWVTGVRNGLKSVTAGPVMATVQAVESGGVGGGTIGAPELALTFAVVEGGEILIDGVSSGSVALEHIAANRDDWNDIRFAPPEVGMPIEILLDHNDLPAFWALPWVRIWDQVPSHGAQEVGALPIWSPDLHPIEFGAGAWICRCGVTEINGSNIKIRVDTLGGTAIPATVYLSLKRLAIT